MNLRNTAEPHDPRFTLTPDGVFLQRDTRRDKHQRFSNKKVCLVATDVAFLADLLYGLSRRADCSFVKYTAEARDGMYLGRCFLATDEAAVELCLALKGHPRLMASLQDDDFFNAHRPTPIPPGGCGVWDDLPRDAAAVLEVHRRAFGRPDEAALVEAVRASRAPTISLIAQIAPGDGDKSAWPTVGHVLLSPVTIDGAGEPRGLGLGPLAVVPEHQRRGFGARLARAALERAKLLGYAYVVVLGHPSYYPRFGFVPASRFGLRYAGAPADAFMAFELEAGALSGVSGEVRYLPAFTGV